MVAQLCAAGTWALTSLPLVSSMQGRPLTHPVQGSRPVMRTHLLKDSCICHFFSRRPAGQSLAISSTAEDAQTSLTC